ncbi:hypothetical protein V3C99_013642 [Haemonchus contortus]|uniref:Uncharacterized protein n=1 Tax=Haemonchus contortus TaxID=6289 RepID=A0A7I4Y138_HAECO
MGRTPNVTNTTKKTALWWRCFMSNKL